MRLKTCLAVLVAGIFAFGCNLALAQDEGRDHDRGHDREESREARDHDAHDRDARENDHFYADRDHDTMHGWYSAHHDHLPPGLRDRDRLPPEMERRLVVRGILPVELRGKMYPCPPDLERQLPPPPPDCAHVFIGGHVVLVNRVNFQVVDVFHLQL